MYGIKFYALPISFVFFAPGRYHRKRPSVCSQNFLLGEGGFTKCCKLTYLCLNKPLLGYYNFMLWQFTHLSVQNMSITHIPTQ